MTDTTQPHSLPSYLGYDEKGYTQAQWADAQSQLNAMRVERDAALVLAASHSNECEKWAAMHQRSKAEIAALKAVDVDRIMVLADKYAYATKVAEEEGSCQADYDECNAAREALRASLASPEGSPR